jgi:hypothetical protein
MSFRYKTGTIHLLILEKLMIRDYTLDRSAILCYNTLSWIDNGKPVARRGRKAEGLYEAAGLPNRVRLELSTNPRFNSGVFYSYLGRNPSGSGCEFEGWSLNER